MQEQITRQRRREETTQDTEVPQGADTEVDVDLDEIDKLLEEIENPTEPGGDTEDELPPRPEGLKKSAEEIVEEGEPQEPQYVAGMNLSLEEKNRLWDEYNTAHELWEQAIDEVYGLTPEQYRAEVEAAEQELTKCGCDFSVSDMLRMIFGR